MKKFSFSKEYKKTLNNPILNLYKFQLNSLNEAYLEELKERRQLQKEIGALELAIYNMLARKANRENLSDEEFKKLVKNFIKDLKSALEKQKQKGKNNV